MKRLIAFAMKLFCPSIAHVTFVLVPAGTSVKVATFDADPQIVDYVKQGTVTAVVSQQPYLQAQQSLQIAKDAIQGKPVTYLHNLGMVLINKDNVDTDAAKPGLFKRLFGR